MMIAALAVLELFRPALIEGEDLYAAVDRMAEDLLHIVEVWL